MAIYETPFTKENILEIKTVVSSAINAYAKERNIRLDYFTALAALGQLSYEMTMQIFPNSEEEAKKLQSKMEVLSKDLLKTIEDDSLKEETPAVAQILATIHAHCILLEHYSKVRDESLDTIMDKQESETAPVNED